MCKKKSYSHLWKRYPIYSLYSTTVQLNHERCSTLACSRLRKSLELGEMLEMKSAGTKGQRLAGLERRKVGH